MRELAVLSPHRDDAVFSLSMALRKWCDAGIRVRVLNFFTHSAYGPQAIACLNAAEVSDFRRREDRFALRSLHPRIEVRDYQLVDAPLRLQLPIAQVMDLQAASVRNSDVGGIAGELSRTYTLAPLGIGDHVDHRTVRDAAIATIPAHQLAFYEDVPYATWTAEQAILDRVVEVGHRVRRKHRALIVRSAGQGRRIRRMAALYKTQIAPEDGTAMAAFWAHYRGGVRIWIPEHSAAWLAIRS